ESCRWPVFLKRRVARPVVLQATLTAVRCFGQRTAVRVAWRTTGRATRRLRNTSDRAVPVDSWVVFEVCCTHLWWLKSLDEQEQRRVVARWLHWHRRQRGGEG